MKNSGNNGVIFVTHDKHPEFGQGVVLCESYHLGSLEEVYYAVRFENVDCIYNAAIENLSLLENIHES